MAKRKDRYVVGWATNRVWGSGGCVRPMTLKTVRNKIKDGDYTRGAKIYELVEVKK